MKKFLLFLAVFFIFPHTILAADTQKWKTAKSTHFIVHYKNAPESFIEKIIRESEDHYAKIADRLGFTRYNFWLWDNRANIYIYDDMQDYHKNTGQPTWSSGASIPRQKTIYTFPYAKNFFETVLPHEMGHIIFREFVGFDNRAIPIWLDEGVATYQENNKYSYVDRLVKETMKNRTFFDLKKLSTIQPKTIFDPSYVQVFYLESASVVSFLIKKYGKDSFMLFCQYLRDKKDFEAALRSVYPLLSLDELDKAWQNYIKGIK